jgi:drug/metabolite transporter (DMT)-like permease
MLLMNVLWAASLSSYKALEEYDFMGPGVVVTLRFGVAAVCLLVCWPLFPGRAPRGGDLARTMIMGVVVFLAGQRLQVLGVRLGTAGVSSVLLAMEPLITAVAAGVFLREHIPRHRWVGLLLGMAGVVLLAGVWRADFRMVGVLPGLVFISSFVTEATYSVLGKPIIERAGVMKVVTLALAGATAGNLLLDGPATAEAVRLMPARAWMLIGYLAFFCTALGYSLWFFVIRRTPVNVTVLTIFVQPVAGVAIAHLWLGEPMHLGQLWGTISIATGLAVGLRHKRAWAESSSVPAEIVSK